MNQMNTLTIGGAAAGNISMPQLASDLSGLTMYGFSCLDGIPGFAIDPAVVEMGTRVCGVAWGIIISVAGATLGWGVALWLQRLERLSAVAPVDTTPTGDMPADSPTQ